MSRTYRPRNVKVVLVGDMSVGKTSLVSVFTQNVFRDRYTASVGGLFTAKSVHNGPTSTLLQLWDTAGMERFRSMLPHFMREAHCAIIVYDVHDRRSFLNIREYWLDFVNASAASASRGDIVKILVANKIDLPKDDHTVKESEGRFFAEEHDMFFITTSAKLGINVQALFEEAAKLIDAKIPEPREEYQHTYLESPGFPEPKKTKCCK